MYFGLVACITDKSLFLLYYVSVESAYPKNQTYIKSISPINVTCINIINISFWLHFMFHEITCLKIFLDYVLSVTCWVTTPEFQVK